MLDQISYYNHGNIYNKLVIIFSYYKNSTIEIKDTRELKKLEDNVLLINYTQKNAINDIIMSLYKNQPFKIYYYIKNENLNKICYDIINFTRTYNISNEILKNDETDEYNRFSYEYINKDLL